MADAFAPYAQFKTVKNSLRFDSRMRFPVLALCARYESIEDEAGEGLARSLEKNLGSYSRAFQFGHFFGEHPESAI